MVFGILTAPTEAFETAFDNPNAGRVLLVVLLTALISGFSSYLFLNSVTMGAFFFISSVVQWVVLTLVVLFFEFVHIKKKKGISGTHFAGVASATGKLWTLNLCSSVLLFVMLFVSTRLSEPLLTIVFLILLALLVVLFLAWIIGSLKLLKVVTSVTGAKLLINWVILLILNAAISSLLLLLVSNLISF